jgi:polysaccharide biosynthesis protein VpsQ
MEILAREPAAESRSRDALGRLVFMKWLAVIFSLFIITVIVLADEGRLGWMWEFYDFPYGDKVGHFFIYGLLALILNLYFLSQPHIDSKRLILTVSLVLAALIGLEEWSQSRFPSRTMDIIDLLSGYAGVALFSYFAYRIKR